MIKKWMTDEVLERVQQLVPLAKEVGLSMVPLAVAWVLQNDNVASAFIGASRPRAGSGQCSSLRGHARRRAAHQDRQDPGSSDRTRSPRGQWTALPRPALPEPTALVLGQGTVRLMGHSKLVQAPGMQRDGSPPGLERTGPPRAGEFEPVRRLEKDDLGSEGVLIGPTAADG